MLAALDRYDGSPASEQHLLERCEASLQATLGSRRGGGGRDLVAQAEAEVQADPQGCVRIDGSGYAGVHTRGRDYLGGRFQVLSLRELRERCAGASPRARLRLFVLDGASPLSDIGALQASAPPGSLFQVASQFNCLESPGRFVAPVADYFHDPTQGPRASVSAFPGTLVRHYAAPLPGGRAGERFVQSSSGPELNLLAAVCSPAVAAVRSGYLIASDIADAPAFARALDERFEDLAVGVHDGVEVVLGYDWDGAVAPHEGRPRTIAQAFTSTVAAGMYGTLDARDAAAFAICRSLQRAAYLGTLLGAAALQQERVVLTLIGGGVFGNPVPLIWESILWALEQVRPWLQRDLVVVVNGRNLGEQVPARALRAATHERGGVLIRCDRSGTSVG